MAKADGASVVHDSPSYFSTREDSGGVWRCPLNPRQVDDALMRAEAVRQGAVPPKGGPVDRSTRPVGGGPCDCGAAAGPGHGVAHEHHGVRCAVRYVATRAAPPPPAGWGGSTFTNAWTTGASSGSV